VGLSDLVTPETSADGDEVHLCIHDSSTDGSGNFLCAFGSQTDVSVVVTNNDVSFELSSLTGTSLLLHRHDLHYFVFEVF